MSAVDLGAFGIFAVTCIVALVVGTPTTTVAAVVVGLVAALAIFLNRNFLLSSQSPDGHTTHVSVNGSRTRVDDRSPTGVAIEMAEPERVQLPMQDRETSA